MNTKNIDNATWESLCLKCGKCCHKKMMFKYLFIVDPSHTCEHLAEDKTCKIYDKRLSTGTCLSIRETLDRDLLLPNSCPYTKLRPGYKGFEIPTPEVFDFVLQLLAIIEIEEQELGRDLTPEELEPFFELLT